MRSKRCPAKLLALTRPATRNKCSFAPEGSTPSTPGCVWQHCAGGALVGRHDFVAGFFESVLQGLRRVAADHAALVHQADAIAALGFVQIRGGDEHRQPVANQLVENGPEIAARNWVDTVGGFVQKQNLRMMQQGAHQRQLLLHAAGEIRGLALAERLHARHAEQALDQRLALGLRDPEQVGVEVHVLVDREIAVESEALGHVADLILDGVELASHVVACHPGLAFGGIQQAAQQAQRGGLAGAIRTDQAEDFAARDFEVEMVDRRQFAEAASQVDWRGSWSSVGCQLS